MRDRTLCFGKRSRPLVDRGALVGAFIDSSIRSRTCLAITLGWSGGSKRSFLDAGAAVHWGIPLVEVSRRLVANSLNGQRIGRITKPTVPLRLLISSNHQETITLLIIDPLPSPVILGHPWMVTYKPAMDWKRHEILGWSCLFDKMPA